LPGIYGESYAGFPMPRSISRSRAAFLLAGGKSTRMGENKAFLDFQGQTLLSRALHTLRQAADEVTIVGDPAVFSSYGPVISDIYPNCGPLAGIHSALVHSSKELNLVLAVDMPFVTVEFLRFLLRAAETTPTAIVTVPRTPRGFQPLCALYGRAFAPIAEKALRAGNYKIDATFGDFPLRAITPRELSAAGFDEKHFFNVNTPEDHRAAADLR
jgi:molybdopterin-guanine dinucleotide biosynthesis protein A